VLRGQDVVGRDEERAGVRAALVDGTGVVVAGAAGVGKTAVVRSVVHGLGDRYHVAWAPATRATRDVPFAALAGLLGDADVRLEPARVRAAVLATLSRRAAGRRPVLVVDDAHDLDDASAAVVLGLATEGEVRLAVTLRSGAPVSDAVTALWKDGFVARVDLGPLDRADTATLVEAALAGPLAAPSADLLWQWTRGNALALVELLRLGRQRGLLVREADRWWWRAPLVVPPVLDELLAAHLGRLDAQARDAMAAVVLGEPLPVALLAAVAPPSALAALEDADLVRLEESGGHLALRAAHPLLAAAVRRRLGASRRGRVAAALLAAAPPPRHENAPALVRRAVWQLMAVGPADVGLLLRGSALVRYVDPRLAVRLARRAVAESGGAAAAIALADALVEAGDHGEARRVLERARSGAAPGVVDLATDVELATALAGHRTWAERDPVGGHGELMTVRASLPARSVTEAPALTEARDELDAVTALALLFSARPRDALDAADRLLARRCHPAATTRAELARVTALTLVGRTGDAVAAGESLVSRLESAPGPLPYAAGMAGAALALARLWRSATGDLPLTDPALGRWPLTAGTELLGLRPTQWSLFDGYVRRIVGDRTAAVARLREALVQQSGGEGLFRSEATAWLAITLADDGRPDEAAAGLARCPPDGLAMVPGLEPWSAAAVHAARREDASATERIDEAVEAARGAGAALVELGYLTYAAELRGPGGPAAYARRTAELCGLVDAPRLVAGGAAVLALARRSGGDVERDDLTDLAAQLEAHGLRRQALVLVDAVLDDLAPGRDRTAHLAWAARLRHAVGDDPGGHPAGLTRREGEIAALVADGLTDREIAGRLVISVRTVESHLAHAYRKLGIASRRELAAALRQRGHRS
jgi:DNA-binding CsgD family transcriptional regulator